MSRLRRRSLRGRLARTFVVLGLVSVVMLATVNLLLVRSLLDTSVRSQLETLRDVRGNAIELGVERLLTRVSVLAADPGVVGALDELAEGYAGIDRELADDQSDTLIAVYDDVVARYDEAGVERPDIDDLMPTSVAGRYVQYHYVATNPHPVDERAELIDAGDGSAYSGAHARQHAYLRALAASMGAVDLVLVDSRTDDVVYSVAKRIDLGTDVRTGPHRDSTLGTARARLGGASVTEAVIVDSAFYLPDSSVPVVHVAATVRSGAEEIGAIVVGIPIGVLTDLVSGGGRWEALGLGETGDAYVLGADSRLRTEPRLWFGDRAEALQQARDRGLDERSAGLIDFLGSPVLVQRVDNAAVASAQAGDEFIGVVDGYLGRRTLAAAAPLDVGGLGWTVVTERQTSETRTELLSFLATILLLLVVLLPLLALIGVLLARMLARPVAPLLSAAQRIASGDPDVEVPDLGHNELGDLGLQLTRVADQLREHEAEGRAEEARITSLLESVVPAELVEQVRRGEDDSPSVMEVGTVVALTVRGLPQPSSSEPEALVELTQLLVAAMKELAADHGMERVRVASDQGLFLAGRGAPHDGASMAARFALALDDAVGEVAAEHGVALTAHIGIATGPLGAVVLGRGQSSYGVWGDSVGRAVELAETAPEHGVLADRSFLDALGGQAPGGVTLADAAGVAPGSQWVRRPD